MKIIKTLVNLCPKSLGFFFDHKNGIIYIFPGDDELREVESSIIIPGESEKALFEYEPSK